jgi:predicted ribosome-associated RNA-binding protein Tma20
MREELSLRNEDQQRLEELVQQVAELQARNKSMFIIIVAWNKSFYFYLQEKIILIKMRKVILQIKLLNMSTYKELKYIIIL